MYIHAVDLAIWLARLESLSDQELFTYFMLVIQPFNPMAQQRCSSKAPITIAPSSQAHPWLPGPETTSPFLK